MAKKNKKLSDEKLLLIESQIQKESVPYVYDTKEYPVEVIIAKHKKEQIFVPHYQRNFVWKPEEKSRFIESVFLGVPIMPFLVSVSGEEAELEIIDGSQRIRTLTEYCEGGLKLKGLNKLTELKFGQSSRSHPDTYKYYFNSLLNSLNLSTNVPYLTKLNVARCVGLLSLDLQHCTRLKELDAEKSILNSIVFPKDSVIEKLYLPTTLNQL